MPVLDMNASHLPSGDQAGPWANVFDGLTVMGFEPSEALIKDRARAKMAMR